MYIHIYLLLYSIRADRTHGASWQLNIEDSTGGYFSKMTWIILLWRPAHTGKTRSRSCLLMFWLLSLLVYRLNAALLSTGGGGGGVFSSNTHVQILNMCEKLKTIRRCSTLAFQPVPLRDILNISLAEICYWNTNTFPAFSSFCQDWHDWFSESLPRGGSMEKFTAILAYGASSKRQLQPTEYHFLRISIYCDWVLLEDIFVQCISVRNRSSWANASIQRKLHAIYNGRLQWFIIIVMWRIIACIDYDTIMPV